MAEFKKNTLSHVDVIKLADVLRAHCLTIAGCAIYDTGWSDEKVIEEMAILHPTVKIVINNVTGLRDSLIGPLTKPKPPATLEMEMHYLRQRLDALEEWAAARGPGRGTAFGQVQSHAQNGTGTSK